MRTRAAREFLVRAVAIHVQTRFSISPRAAASILLCTIPLTSGVINIGHRSFA
jgi:hypothetical protein